MPHGIRVIETSTGPKYLPLVSTAVIGVVVTAPDASAGAYPLNTPVLALEPSKAATELGAAGTGRAALQAIADQVTCPVIIVRVAPGADAAATAVNVIGADGGGAKTGMQALLSAQAVTSMRPRIIGAPGLDAVTVATALGVLAGKLNGMAYARGTGATAAQVATYRNTFSARELMLVWPDFTFGGADASVVGRALGLRARIDQMVGFHKTLSNVAVQGVTGIVPAISWDLQSSSTDAGVLNGADVTALIQSKGFRFWGSRTCSSDPEFAFESAVRTNQVLKDTIAEGLMAFSDTPLTPSRAKDIVERINKLFARLKRDGKLIGARAFLEPGANPAGQLAAGQLVIKYKFTPVPPLEDLTLMAEITDEYFEGFDQLAGA